MDYSDFFDKDKPITRIKVAGAQVGGVLNVTPEDSTYEPPVEDVAHAYDYVKKYREEEEAMYLENATIRQENDLFRPDTPTTTVSCIDTGIDAEIACNIYDKYKFERHVKNNNLCINSYQEEITDLISTNSVVVIQGPTGCGKTTQVPQFILDYCQSQEKYCKIAVTQPRRIAAISVAKRVSEERGWPVGTVVGYQVGLDNQTTEDTLLSYMTTGVLLQKLTLQKNLNHFTHIIIDEVHERDAEMDFLLLVVKRFLQTVSHHVKVILMSATFDVDYFAKYFKVPKGKTLVSAPVLDVTKQQPYPVNTYYLNQFDQILERRTLPIFEEPCLHPELLPAVVKLIRIFNTFEINHVKHGSVLVFLPGIYEIEDMYELLKKENEKNNKIKWLIVPLHSSITVEEQKRAFMETPAGHRKIILSTNIAESSITVPDVVYVIDFCLTKILINDPTTNYSSLKLTWASHTNCQQRSGRVGRVSAGRVYRFVPEKFYHQYMPPDILPEMLRTPLQRLILLTKMLDLQIPPHGVLALAIDPPPIHNIKQTICLLKEAGALMLTCHGEYNVDDGDLTCMGRIMAQLPLDIYVSKLIILGYLFSTFKECIIMGAAISLQNIFSNPFNERMKAYQSKLSWADCSSSDLIAYLHVYVVWERNKHNNLFRMQGGEKLWMKRNFLQPRVMREWRILVQEIKTRLTRLGITEPIQGREGNLTEHEKAMMLKVVISGAFYPNYFVRSSEGGQVDEGSAVRQLGGRDPYTTVYFTSKPDNQPVELYVSSIRELLKECGQNMYISHDNTNKIYIQFKHDMVPNTNERSKNIALIPGKIAIEVYNAVKYRHSKLPTTIKCVSAEEAQLRVKQWKKYQEQNQKQTEDVDQMQQCVDSIIPGYEIEHIEIRVSYVNSPGHFFAHPVDNVEIMNLIERIERDLNTKQLSPVTDEVVISKMYAAPFEGKYYRARVICVVPGQSLESCKYQVIFIDYGNIATIMKKDLRYLLLEFLTIPPLALECVLMGIQPSHEMHIHALWSTKATEEFIQLTKDSSLFGKVYSVVDNIISLELYTKNSKKKNSTEHKTINELFIEAGFAQPAIESFLSQDNHKKREFVQTSERCTEVYAPKIQWYDKSNEMPAPENCRFSMTLNGPFSPLEMKIFSIVQSSLNKHVTVEWNSVNSVLLDSEPQDPHDRLLVAASVNQNISQERLSLRHTTIMPNIHGFPALMAMLFCPTLDLHTNKDGSRLTSILCGLGVDAETKQSLFAAHDLALNLDFELTKHDILKINEIRYFMNSAINAINAARNNTEPSLEIGKCQTEIRRGVRTILKTKRKDMPREVLQSMYTWGKLPPNVEVVRPMPIYMDENDIWPLHHSINLVDSTKVEVRQHLNQLRDYATKTCVMNEIACKLCNIVLYDVVEMRLHLVSTIHIENEQIFNDK